MAIADQSKLECIQWQQVGRGYTAENYSRCGQVAKTGYASIILFKVAAQQVLKRGYMLNRPTVSIHLALKAPFD